MRKFETVDEVKSVTAHEVINTDGYKRYAELFMELFPGEGEKIFGKKPFSL